MPGHLAQILIVGVVATLVMDLILLARRAMFGAPMLNYGLVGRWIAGLRKGELMLGPDRTRPTSGETALGWAAHYAIGIVFAAALVASADGVPGFGQCIAFGLLSALAPFLVLQPALGFGIAASKALRPNLARANTLIAHLAFGFGLYVGVWALGLARL